MLPRRRRILPRWLMSLREKRIKSGLCKFCGEPRDHYPTVCDACNVKVREWQRHKSGSKPWRAGGRGRPPKDRGGVSIEQTCRDLLEIAVRDGLVGLKAREWADPHPQSRSNGELARMANALAEAMRKRGAYRVKTT